MPQKKHAPSTESSSEQRGLDEVTRHSAWTTINQPCPLSYLFNSFHYRAAEALEQGTFLLMHSIGEQFPKRVHVFLEQKGDGNRKGRFHWILAGAKKLSRDLADIVCIQPGRQHKVFSKLPAHVPNHNLLTLEFRDGLTLGLEANAKVCLMLMFGINAMEVDLEVPDSDRMDPTRHKIQRVVHVLKHAKARCHHLEKQMQTVLNQQHKILDATAKQAKESLKQQLHTAQQQVIVLDSQLGEHMDRELWLAKEAEKAQTQVIKLDSQMQEHEQHEQKLVEEVKKDQAEMKHKDDKIAALEAELSHLRKDIFRVHDQFESEKLKEVALEQNIVEVRKQLETIQQDNTVTGQKDVLTHKDAQIKDLNDELSILRRKIWTVGDQLEVQKELYAKKEKEIHSLVTISSTSCNFPVSNLDLLDAFKKAAAEFKKNTDERYENLKFQDETILMIKDDKIHDLEKELSELRHNIFKSHDQLESQKREYLRKQASLEQSRSNVSLAN